eukprot:COSAG01_NODE_3658_length_5818_cov_3.227138_1_plen_232_part_10
MCEGYHIAPFSRFPDEAEVLLRPLSRFEVVSAQKRLEQRHLQEKAPKGGFPDEVTLRQLPRAATAGGGARRLGQPPARAGAVPMFSAMHPSPSPPAAAAAPAQMDSLAELAAVARCSEAEVLALAEAELAELLVELQVGVIARKRLVAHVARARAEAAQLAADEAEARRLQEVEAAQARASQLQAEARRADAHGVRRLLAAPGVDDQLATVCCQRLRNLAASAEGKAAVLAA